VEGRHRASVTAARLVMLVLAVVTGWGAVTAAAAGHVRDAVLAGPPAAAVRVAPAPLESEDVAAVVGQEDAGITRQARDRSSSRSQNRVDPRFTSCTAVRAAGLGPYRRGRDAEYAWYADPDGDGVVCA
jgi:Excalibur calcium-binding domain